MALYYKDFDGSVNGGMIGLRLCLLGLDSVGGITTGTDIDCCLAGGDCKGLWGLE